MKPFAALAFAAAVLATGSANAGELAAKSTLNLRVVIPAIVSLKVVESTPTAAVVDIVCTMKGFRLNFEITDPSVVAVDIDGFDFPVRVVPGGTQVQVPVLSANDRRSRRALRYRVQLAAGAAGGPRRSPVALSIAGL